MRESALAFLACPACGGELALQADERASDGHVMTGRLTCAGCRDAYPIERGVPRLVHRDVPADAVETSDRFGAEWETFRHIGAYDEQWFRGWLDPIGPDDFRGKAVLEGGCGKGRHSLIAAQWGARDVVSLDLGAAAYVAFEHTRALPNVHIVRADLMHPPVRAVFDLAFSVGVLHHLPTPRTGFDALCSRVRPGGKIAIWVYGLESNEWIVRWVDPVRQRVTAELPPRWLYWLSLAPTAALAAAVQLYRIPGLGAKLPYGDYMRLLGTVPLREVHTIVYDQLVTPIAFYLPESEVRGWFERPELGAVQIAWHNKNSWRACAVVEKSIG